MPAFVGIVGTETRESGGGRHASAVESGPVFKTAQYGRLGPARIVQNSPKGARIRCPAEIDHRRSCSS
jgi:hypothetical protein